MWNFFLFWGGAVEGWQPGLVVYAVGTLQPAGFAVVYGQPKQLNASYIYMSQITGQGYVG